MRATLTILFFSGIVGHSIGQFTLADMYVGFFLQDKDSIERQNRIVIDVTNEQWIDGAKEIKMKWYSWGLSFSRMFEYPFSKKFSIAFGPAVRTLHHYNNAQFFQYINSSNTIVDSLVPYRSTVSYSANKLVLSYVDLCSELRIKGGKKNNFKFFIGFRGGYMFNNHIKFVDGKTKYKKYNIDGVEKFSFGPTLRIGFGNVCIYGNYLMTPVYKNNSNQKINTMSVGLSFLWL